MFHIILQTKELTRNCYVYPIVRIKICIRHIKKILIEKNYKRIYKYYYVGIRTSAVGPDRSLFSGIALIQNIKNYDSAKGLKERE